MKKIEKVNPHQPNILMESMVLPMEPIGQSCLP